MSVSLPPHRLQPARLLRPWDFPGKNPGVGCHFLLQGIFLTQESNPGLTHCRQTPYLLSHQGSPTCYIYYNTYIYILPCLVITSESTYDDCFVYSGHHPIVLNALSPNSPTYLGVQREFLNVVFIFYDHLRVFSVLPYVSTHVCFWVSLH